MDVESGSLYWPAVNKNKKSYPSLSKNIDCDVLIIGGGITGALVCQSMSELDIDIVLIDKHEFGSGSTSATTALIQYETDLELYKLIKLIGKEKAVENYKLCREAIYKLGSIVKDFKIDCNFLFKKSLYLASDKKADAKLENEFKTRKKYGFKLDFLKEEEIKNMFNLKASSALLSADAAQLDPYKLTCQLIEKLVDLGARAFEKTKIKNFSHFEKGVIVNTDKGYIINTKKIIFATGFESQQFFKEKVAKLVSTYALTTTSMPDEIKKIQDVVIYETARPYLYVRTTVDNRLIIGGEDEDFFDPKKRDKLIAAKSKAIIKKFRKYYDLKDIKVDYKWAGTFGETQDSLPYIGETKEFPNAYFALAYGGNGIIFSVLAGEIIKDLFLYKKNKNQLIYKFGR